jgi:hypothetical protein
MIMSSWRVTLMTVEQLRIPLGSFTISVLGSKAVAPYLSHLHDRLHNIISYISISAISDWYGTVALDQERERMMMSSHRKHKQTTTPTRCR